jgi:hypothetical protein
VGKFLKSENGFSIVQVMVAAGLASIVMLAFMNMFSDAYKKEADLKSRQEARDFADELYVAVMKGSCGLIAPGVTFDSKAIAVDLTSDAPIEIPQLYGAYGQVFSPGTKYGNLTFSANGIRIFPIKRNSLLMGEELAKILEKSDAEKTTLITAGGYIIKGTAGSLEYLAEMVMQLDKPKGAGAGVIPIRTLVLFETKAPDPANPTALIISGCRSIPEVKAAKLACEGTKIGSQTGFWDDQNFVCTFVLPNESQSTAGHCPANDSCNVNPASYISNSIP